MRCEYCGSDFVLSKFNPKQKFCSTKCYIKKRSKEVSEYNRWRRKNDPEFKIKEKQYRDKYKNKNPEKYIEQFKRGNKKKREQYNSDPEYRKKRSEYNKQYLKNNPDKKQIYYEKDNSRKRQRYIEDAEHREVKKEKTKKYHQENPDINLKSYLKLIDDPIRMEKKKKWSEEYWKKNKEKISRKHKEYYQNNKDYFRKFQKEWLEKEENKEKNKLYRKKWYYKGGKLVNQKYRREKLKSDPAFRAGINLRLRLNEYIKKGKYRKFGSFRDKLGCDWDFFKRYMEEQFVEDMSWENYGTYWHIDHIIPLAAWDLSKEEDQKLAAHYSNLRPLKAIDNLKKGKKF